MINKKVQMLLYSCKNEHLNSFIMPKKCSIRTFEYFAELFMLK